MNLIGLIPISSGSKTLLRNYYELIVLIPISPDVNRLTDTCSGSWKRQLGDEIRSPERAYDAVWDLSAVSVYSCVGYDASESLGRILLDLGNYRKIGIPEGV